MDNQSYIIEDGLEASRPQDRRVMDDYDEISVMMEIKLQCSLMNPKDEWCDQLGWLDQLTTSYPN